MKYILAKNLEAANSLAERGCCFSSRKEMEGAVYGLDLHDLKLFKIYEGCLGIRVVSDTRLDYKIRQPKQLKLNFHEKPQKLPQQLDRHDEKSLRWLQERGFRQ